MGVPVPVICCLIAGVVIVLIFSGAFFVELFFPKNKENESAVVTRATDDFDIDEMLSRLEEKTKLEEKANTEEVVEVKKVVKPVVAPAVLEEKKQEIKEDPEETFDFDALFKELEAEANLNKAEEKKEEVKEEPAMVEPKEEVKPEVKEEIVVKTIITGPEFDYNVRIETINESLAKLEKDLSKATREVNKYEKTAKRKAKNEKLLDRKSAELTNLNLVLYNVNNIDDIDPEKKKKQEDLVEHIAELKNSIQSAEEYLEQNKDKYQNNAKIKDFLTGEKQRYNEEITELTHLIEEAKKNKKQ